MTDLPFWLTDEGLRIRLQDLANLVVTRTKNQTIINNAKDLGIRELIYRVGSNPCEDCKKYANKKYAVNQYKPNIPRHIHCICTWDVVIGKVEPGVN